MTHGTDHPHRNLVTFNLTCLMVGRYPENRDRERLGRLADATVRWVEQAKGLADASGTPLVMSLLIDRALHLAATPRGTNHDVWCDPSDVTDRVDPPAPTWHVLVGGWPACGRWTPGGVEQVPEGRAPMVPDEVRCVLTGCADLWHRVPTGTVIG